MVDIEYANAYSEVLEILKYIPKEDYEKIDKEKINVFKANHNKEYIFKYNPKLTLNEQNVSPKAKTIIAILFRDYWASNEQREKILAKEKYDKEKIEEEKREKYKTDNIFATRVKENITKEEHKDLVIYENKNLFKKILNFIKRLFKK